MVERDGCIEIGSARQIVPTVIVESAVTAQGARNLADAIGAKIETNTGIVVTDCRHAVL
jgi:hypothetical protein